MRPFLCEMGQVELGQTGATPQGPALIRFGLQEAAGGAQGTTPPFLPAVRAPTVSLPAAAHTLSSQTDRTRSRLWPASRNRSSAAFGRGGL